MPKIERRLFETTLSLETREDKPPVIRGHAAVFGKLSDNLGGFRERIKPGAFAKSLKGKPDVRALFNHDPNFILGRTKSGTLRVTEDERGLAYEVDPPDTQVARDLMESLKRGDVDQSSFGFYVITDEWHKENGHMVRELVEVDIHNGDVSPVTYPAYPQTSVSVRTLWPEGVPEEVTKALNGEAHDPTEELRNKLAFAEAREAAETAKVASLQGQLEALQKEYKAAIDAALHNSEIAAREKRALEGAADASELAEAGKVQLYKNELEQVQSALESTARGLMLAEQREQVLSNIIRDIAAKVSEVKAEPHPVRTLLDAPIKSLKAVISDLSHRLVLYGLKAKS